MPGCRGRTAPVFEKAGERVYNKHVFCNFWKPVFSRHDREAVMNEKQRIEQIQDTVHDNLEHVFGVSLENATNEQCYKAVALTVRDRMERARSAFAEKAEKEHVKQIYYLCMEFLVGRSLKNSLYNLKLEDSYRRALAGMGLKLEDLYEEEPDAGLGNGGLGRLAACFMDSLATLGYPATGYSLCYEYGIFRQKLVDGWQTELPDFWLPGGKIWLRAEPEKSVEVRFNGHIEEYWNNHFHIVNHKDFTKVIAVPYDMNIAGYGGKGISRLRLWRATSADFDMKLFNGGNYMRAMEQKAMAEIITKVLYPDDNHVEGKSLRLSQQYFLVSAAVQDIIRHHLFTHRTLDSLPEVAAIHLNDTHPVLAIPEMMRVMLDECGYGWDDAWDIVQSVFAYTNHTVMPEALECWGIDLFRMRLPRIYQIIEEINRQFCAGMHNRCVDGYKVGRMAPWNDGYIKMANLAVVGSHSVNGVSKLHSEILKNRIFHDFYTEMPEKFTSVTNGIAYRRWLCQDNPGLTALLKELIGSGFVLDASKLEDLLAYRDDPSVLQNMGEVKRENKIRFSNYVKRTQGIMIDPDSIFDAQVKRLHEYKRQHLNALQILMDYRRLRENPGADFTPRTYIFGAKAAAGYYFAKQIIRFIVNLGKTINADKRVNQKMKVVYLEDYRVTLAELLMPAADISEQISLAGTEASGTSNMKMMINGAVTLGTLDGANVEIRDAVGEKNMILFGMNAGQAAELKRAGYRPQDFAGRIPRMGDVLREMSSGFCGVSFRDISDSLLGSDPYMVMADFASYDKARRKSADLYADHEAWQKMCLINVAKAGRFSSDRAIQEYARDIWHADPISEFQKKP